MRRILVMAGLGYLCIAVVFGIHAVIVQRDEPGDGSSISLDILDRAIRWPVRILD
jgi:hypothetical protein